MEQEDGESQNTFSWTGWMTGRMDGKFHGRIQGKLLYSTSSLYLATVRTYCPSEGIERKLHSSFTMAVRPSGLRGSFILPLLWLSVRAD